MFACTGKVALYGKSWGGFNGLQVAALRPIHLAAVISLYSTDDRYVCRNVCMHVCMCVCMYVCVHACMYVCMYAYMHVCMRVCICMHAYMCACVCMYFMYCLPIYKNAGRSRQSDSRAAV